MQLMGNELVNAPNMKARQKGEKSMKNIKM
jgi:hypothetical protein